MASPHDLQLKKFSGETLLKRLQCYCWKGWTPLPAKESYEYKFSDYIFIHKVSRISTSVTFRFGYLILHRERWYDDRDCFFNHLGINFCVTGFWVQKTQPCWAMFVPTHLCTLFLWGAPSQRTYKWKGLNMCLESWDCRIRQRQCTLLHSILSGSP
jgi:hypothetical protein